MEIQILKYCRKLKKGVASTLISGAMVSSVVPMQSCSSEDKAFGMQSTVPNGPAPQNNSGTNNSFEEKSEIGTGRTIGEEHYQDNNHAPNKYRGHKMAAALLAAGLVASTVTLGVLYGNEVSNNDSLSDENRILQDQVAMYKSMYSPALASLSKGTMIDTAGSYNNTVVMNTVTRRLESMGYNARQLQGTSLVETIKSLTDDQAIAILPIIQRDFLAYIESFSRPNLVNDYNAVVKEAKVYLHNNCATMVSSSSNSCGKGKFYGVGASGATGCLSCPDANAKSCMITNNGTAVQSTSCNDGYFLDGYSICMKCISANCANCNSDGTCNRCDLGYYNNNGSCSPCNQAMPGCHYCSSATKCILCFDQGKYISTNGSSCTDCSSIIPGCTICTSDPLIGYTTCSSCAKSSELGALFVHPTGLQCNSCSAIIANCQTCKEVGGKSLCEVCTNNNYNYLSKDQTKCDICQNIIPGCTSCLGSANSSTTCNACDSSKSLFLSEDSSKCGLCADRFEYCTSCTLNGSNQPICVSCATTLFPNSLNVACLPCGIVISGCSTCTVTNSGVTQCSSCGLDSTSNDQLFVTSNKLGCVLCSSLMPNCDTCTSSSICATCDPGYHLDGSGNCVDKTTLVANASKPFPVNGTFDRCALFAEVLVGSNSDTFGLGIVCKTCASGSMMSSGACVSCNQNCATCNSTDPCLTCNLGYTQSPTGCSLSTYTTTGGVILDSVKKTGNIILDCGSANGTQYYPIAGNSDCNTCSNIIMNCTSCDVNGAKYYTVCKSCVAGSNLASNALSCFSRA